MSEPVRVTRLPRGMVTLRADLAAVELRRALASAAGCAVPPRRRIVFGPTDAAAWMSPDELLILCPYGEAAARAAALEEAMGEALHLAVDMSDARTLFRLEGPGARDVLAKGAPVDLAPEAFGPGDFRRSRLAQAAAAFWTPTSGVFELMCFASVADYVEAWLRDAAAPGRAPGLFLSAT